MARTLPARLMRRLDLARDEVGQSDHTVGLTQEMALQMEREVEPVSWVDLGVMRNDHDGNAHAAQPPHEEDVPIAHHGDDRGIGPFGLEPLHDRAQDPANVERARHELPRIGVGVEWKIDRAGERLVLQAARRLLRATAMSFAHRCAKARPPAQRRSAGRPQSGPIARQGLSSPSGAMFQNEPGKQTDLLSFGGGAAIETTIFLG